MGDIERQPISGRQPETEILYPHHFYAAYVFDQPNDRDTDIETIIEQSLGLSYPVRYWWLSDAMELQGFPDQLIVCVHHHSASEIAGMDLYDALKEKKITWDELKAAVVDEYRNLGKPVESLGDIRSPYGNWLFPNATPDSEYLSQREGALFLITEEDVREEAASHLGRKLTNAELIVVLAKFLKALEWMDWSQYLHEVIHFCQAAGFVDPNADEQNDVVDNQ